MRRLVLLFVWCALFWAAPAAAQDVSHGTLPHTSTTDDIFDYVEGAHRLEGEILAPCCWNQTLDIHGSEISNSLRREIRTRLKKGDDLDVIRQDIVARYGTKILAVPPGSPLRTVAIALSLTFAVAGAGAGWMLVRWRRRARRARAEAKAEAVNARDAAPDKWDDRLEAELSNLD
jgi:cytochrome c-type biogenesis protein CcmH